MERELTEKFGVYIGNARRHLSKGRHGDAYDDLIDALYTLGAVLAYRDTGMLMHRDELIAFLSGRHPEVARIIEAYSGVTPSDDVLGEMLEEVSSLAEKLGLEFHP